MLRYFLTTLVSLSLGLTGFAQTKAPKELPGLLTNNPGKVVSNSVPLPELGTAKPISFTTDAKEISQPIPRPESVKDKGVVPANHVTSGIVGHTTSCSDGAACSTCSTCPPPAKKHRSCFDCLRSLFSYHPNPTPCECQSTPSPYRPPLVAYFSCKGAPFTLNTQSGCSTHPSGATQQFGWTEPNGSPIGNSIPVVPVPATVPTLTVPTKEVPPMSPTISSTKKNGTLQTAGYSSTPTATNIKPLSLYAPGGVKTTSSMQKAEASPPLKDEPSTIIPGFRRLGGAKGEPVTSTSLSPWK